eukprot:COSAG06_NODE_23865_length_679_cov_1.129310_1_plen_20_part_10
MLVLPNVTILTEKLHAEELR